MKVKLDLDAFWNENAASSGKPFSTDKPRCPVALPVDDHWLLEEMQVPSTVRYYRDAEYRAQVNKACNDRLEEAIGVRRFPEDVGSRPPLRIEEVFGSHQELTEGGTPWLEPGVKSIEELRELVERVQKLSDRELEELVFADGRSVAAEALDAGRPKRMTPWSRGPATIATSVMGTTEYLYAIVDYPAVMEQFYECLTTTLIRYQRLMERRRNVSFTGYAWLDDNCCLVSPELYERFCLPMMARVFAEFAPDPSAWRFQHSDSAMAHLLPILAMQRLHGVNLGPTLSVQEIRQHMPRTEIHGQVAPMTLRNGTLADVVAEVQRDFAGAGADGGLLITTAGSISAGTSLEAIRGLMWAVQEQTRYQ